MTAIAHHENYIQSASAVYHSLERLGVVDFYARINVKTLRVEVFASLRGGHTVELDAGDNGGRVTVSRTTESGVNRREKSAPWRVEAISIRKHSCMRDAFLSLAFALEDYGNKPDHNSLGARSCAKLLFKSVESELKTLEKPE